MQGFQPAENGHKSQIFQDDYCIEYGGSVSGFSVFDVEEGETVDDSDNGIVQAFFPRVFAKVRVLPDDPRCHDQPMDN